MNAFPFDNCPVGWSRMRLGQVFDERREKVSDKDFAPLSVTMNGVVPQLETAAKTDDGDNRKRVCAGDLVINSRSDRKGASGLASSEGSVSLINLVLKPRGNFPRYLEYLLRSRPFQEEFYRWGSGIVADLWTTRFSAMKDIVVTLPSEDEQRLIIKFLDIETAKIDAVLVKQDEFLRQLDQYCRALIDQAVTGGIVLPDVAQGGGMPWTGAIPTEWSVLPLRRVVSKFVDYRGSTPEKLESGIPLITASAVRHGTIDHSRNPVFISELEYDERMIRGLPAIGDVVLTTEAPLGEVAQISQLGQAIGQRVILFKVNEKYILPRMLFYFLMSPTGQDELYSAASGSTAIGIKAERLKGIRIIVPPYAKQKTILCSLDRELERLDTLKIEPERLIKVLHERRAALITAAVTGQIDVTNATLKQAAE